MDFSHSIQKIAHYEYWPWYMFYLPLLPIYAFGVFRTKRLLYFTAANPGIEMGGFFGEKKDEILDLISEAYKATSLSVRKQEVVSEDILKKNNPGFPLIAKPNVGERGYGVRVINSYNELVEYHNFNEDYVVQHFVDYPLELGILYIKFPDEEKGMVTSITEKEFLTVIGDGINTTEHLLKSHPRGKLYLESLQKDCSAAFQIIPKKDESFIVHKIGNHTKGTRFIDANSYISETLNTIFDKINNQVNGVFYGRYDLKVPSYQDLIQGQNIKIFELNGVSSEPGHMYDQPTIFHAYLILARHWLYIIKIAHQNIKNGVETTPFSYFITKIKSHFK